MVEKLMTPGVQRQTQNKNWYPLKFLEKQVENFNNQFNVLVLWTLGGVKGIFIISWYIRYLFTDYSTATKRYGTVADRTHNLLEINLHLMKQPREMNL